MHDKQKLAEKAVIGLVAVAVSLQVLAGVLPRVTPDLIVLAIIFVVVRLVLFHTRKW
jgi:hypothetical protein